MSTTSSSRLRELIEASNLRDLFVDVLMWENSTVRVPVGIDGFTYRLAGIAQKAGAVALECSSDADGRIPSTPIRSAIEAQASRFYHEHLIIYLNDNRTEQLWRPGSAARNGNFTPSHRCFTSGIGEGILQVARRLRFKIEDEPSIAEVGERIRQAFHDDRFEYYQDYFERLNAAESEAGIRRHHFRKSIWHYRDNIEYQGLDPAQAEAVMTLAQTRELGLRIVAASRPCVPLDTVYSPANARKRRSTGRAIVDSTSNEPGVRYWGPTIPYSPFVPICNCQPWTSVWCRTEWGTTRVDVELPPRIYCKHRPKPGNGHTSPPCAGATASTELPPPEEAPNELETADAP